MWPFTLTAVVQSLSNVSDPVFDLQAITRLHRAQAREAERSVMQFRIRAGLGLHSTPV